MPLPIRVLVFLLLLLAPVLVSWAEPIAPLLSPAAVNTLRTQLQRTPPDTNRVLLLLQLSDALLSRHRELNTNLESADEYCQQASRLSQELHFVSGRIGSLYALGRLRSYRTSDTLGLAYIRQGIGLSQHQGRRALEALGWYYLAESSPFTTAYFTKSLLYYQRARALYRQLGNTTNEAYLLKCIADIHLWQGKSGQVISELQQVLVLYHKARGPQRLHYTYDLLLSAHKQMGNYKEALRYGLAAVESAQSTQDTLFLGDFYSRLASLYSEQKDLVTALVYYRKAFEHFQRRGISATDMGAAGNIASILVAQGRAPEALAFYTRVTKSYPTSSPHVAANIAHTMGKIHIALGHYEVAKRHYAQLQNFLATGSATDLEKANFYRSLGKLDLLTHHYGEAQNHFQQALALENRYGNFLSVAELHLFLFKVDSAQGRFPAAIAHYQRYKRLNDSVFNEAKNKQLASLEIQYDTRKKEQNIALLTRQTQAQQARLRQREFQRNALVVGSLLLAGLLLLGYNRYRLKQRATRLLEAQQAEINQQNLALQHLLTEKDWMLKEIHHRVKNNLEVISSLLETQSDYLLDPAALAALREGQNRVHAMALIHQKLYQSDNLAVVDMAAYIRDITEHLLESFDCQATVHMRLAVAPIQLEVTLATPLGLIINEALTNALKYAFPYRQPGTVAVELVETGPQQLRLTIADDGVGFPPQFDVESNSTMGLTIMRGLSGQLDGQLHITQNGGVHVRLDFGAVTAPTGAFRTGSAATPF